MKEELPYIHSHICEVAVGIPSLSLICQLLPLPPVKAASLIGRATSVRLVCEDSSSNVSMAARQPRH
jgi:hypothetical protein